jgi:hypothetical protein
MAIVGAAQIATSDDCQKFAEDVVKEAVAPGQPMPEGGVGSGPDVGGDSGGSLGGGTGGAGTTGGTGSGESGGEQGTGDEGSGSKGQEVRGQEVTTVMVHLMTTVNRHCSIATVQQSRINGKGNGKGTHVIERLSPSTRERVRLFPSKRRRQAPLRTQVVWGVYDNSGQLIATVAYSDEAEARQLALQLSKDKRSTHYVQPVKQRVEAGDRS